MNNFLVVLKKELKDIFRDKKTIIFSILLPIIAFPLIFKVMSSSAEDSAKKATEQINIVVQGDTSSSVYNLLKSQSNINIKDIDDPDTALKDGDIQLIVKIPEGFDKKITEKKDANIEILIDDNSNNSSIASSYVSELFNGMEDKIVSDRLTSAGINPSILKPFNVDVKSGVNTDGEINHMATMLSGMIPSFVIIFMLSPTLAIAADLGAGEKERNTFEPLLSTSCSRSALLWGKIIAMSIVSAIALILSMASIYYAMGNMSGMDGGFNISLDSQSIAIIFVLLLLLLLAICSIQISISIYAKSVKEAGTYLSGIITPVMVISYIPMFMDAKGLSNIIFHVPVANSVAVMKEIMAGVFDPTHIAIVFAWQLVYLVSAVLITRYMFSKEEVVFRS